MNVNLPEAVFLRPGMYTLSGTYEEVIAFLEGYYSGMAKGNPYAIPVSEWASFRTWLSKKLGLPASEVFLKFRNLYEDNSTSLEKMRACFSDFRSEGTNRQKASSRSGLRGQSGV